MVLYPQSKVNIPKLCRIQHSTANTFAFRVEVVIVTIT